MTGGQGQSARRQTLVGFGLLIYLAIGITFGIELHHLWAVVGIYLWAAAAFLLAVNVRKLLGLPRRTR